ncbi:glycosyltransferase family 2 protein [Palleronia sp. LCG004]|uniref:glycosyltransferase family 2 protein n=1 Tax=Palleronia sp. LCG004 TaxID=3079304 RepID=UPI002943D88E|nr:glycosyltransferase family 2 protein [Palleronia sp. LCG004]WOI55716.1 glycosyltransferase family 2 protein [Palleronia sp. LCG004]
MSRAETFDRSAAFGTTPDLSIVIPTRNEAQNIGPLIDEIAAIADLGRVEIIVVDDGATDGTGDVVRGRMASVPGLRLLAHEYGAGQSAAIRTGVEASRAAIVATLDGDGQNPPADLVGIVRPLADGGCGLVAGQRVARQDAFSRRLASRVANGVRAACLGDGTRDTGCGLKAFRREEFLSLPYFDHMHRFLPALFAREGLAVRHVTVGHRPRGGGRSHYSNLGRALSGIVDLAGVMWLIHRGRGRQIRPAQIAASDIVTRHADAAQ